MKFLIKPHEGDKFALDLAQETTTIGRSHRCNIKLNDTKVSRLHCVLENKNSQVIIRDLNSRNGIKVNGKLKAESVLEDGDVVLIGRAICLFRRNA